MSTVMALRRVQRAEEERLPGLAAGLHGRRVEGVGVAGGAQVVEVEQRRWPASRPRKAGRAQRGSSGRPRHSRRTKGRLGSPASGTGAAVPGDGSDALGLVSLSAGRLVVVDGHRESLGSVSCGRTGCSCMVASRQVPSAASPARNRAVSYVYGGVRCGSGPYGSWRAVEKVGEDRGRTGVCEATAAGSTVAPVREHPGAEEQEAQHGRREVGRDRAQPVRWSAPGSVVAAFRAASEPLVRARPMPKTTRPCAWCRTAPPRPAHPEGEPPVGRGVGDRRDQQGERVGDLGAGEDAEAAVEEQVEEGGQGADDAEPDELAGQPLRYVL